MPMDISTGSKRILLVEPDDRMRDRVEAVLQGAGYDVATPPGPGLSIDQLGSGQFDATLVALEWAGPDHERTLRELKRLGGAPVLVLCGPHDVRAAVRLLRQGAEDYLLRPPDPLEVSARLERILERHELDSRISFFQDEISKKSALRSLEVRSPAMRAVLERLLRVAPMRSTVLIYGESGVGKELVARAIHFNSPRRNRPFIPLNCAAIPASLIESELFGHERGSFTGAHARTRGKFEIAHGGTLFLDEIGEMDPATQVRLLRVLEERELMRVGGDRSIKVDVRVIAATNADLDDLVAKGEFRQDLYYRLKVVTIRVPPLRERRLDTPHLVRDFLEGLARANAVEPKSVTDETLAVLTEYSWPGNVRELKNLMESLLVSVSGAQIRVEDLPPNVRRDRAPRGPPGIEPGTTLAEMERELIRSTLEYTGGNRTHSAELLGIGVRTLQRKIQAYGLTVPSRRRRSRGGRVAG
jgi:DNA-binding NtrC family response regulator